ncbi:SH3 domain-containing protein [Aquimarina algicola]|uniref:SH3 domain-containing protein n=1 Tax=Aquimarina algicola TaxID=2589995 RepID=A0A504J1N2_9FLAO|nr:SH3 domain-containing protein [Aquimarina algicola]TPN80979.1 SH3 domain-containing protein [Aquimarina algicola]
MKKSLHLILSFILINVFSCKEVTSSKEFEPSKKQNTTYKDSISKQKKLAQEKDNEYYYVNAKSGLNYRESPKGKIISKFNLNTKLLVIEKTKILDQVKDGEKTLKGEWYGVEKGKDTVYVFNAFLSDQKSLSEQKINDTSVWLADQEDDCVFDFNTQTDDFLKEIPEFSNYVWDNKQKKATIKLDDGNTLIVTRGGCNHFSFYGNLLLEKSELNLNDESKIFKKALWIAEKLFNKSDLNFINESLNKRNFEIEQSENQKKYIFQIDRYCDMTIVVEKTNNNQISIEIGYDVC